MIQSITFIKPNTNPVIKKNTWDDWKIIAKSRPVFPPPKLKSSYVDLPGSNGSLDLSEALTGYPVYENRSPSFEFYVVNGYGEWQTRYDEISNFLHGQVFKIILEDDPSWYYYGRVTVDEWNSSSPPWSTIKITCTVEPFKWKLTSSIDDWIWDTFNFDTDIMYSPFVEIDLDGTESAPSLVVIPKELIGTAPVIPEITYTPRELGGTLMLEYTNDFLGIDMKIQNGTQETITAGTEKLYDCIFYGLDQYVLSFVGTGKITLDFRAGRL